MSEREEELSEDLLNELDRIIASDVPPVTHVRTFCNVCEHEIFRCGSEWKCSEGCQCLMIGCVLKRSDLPDAN